MFKSILGILVGVTAGSAAFGATSDFECFKEQAGSEVCLVIPEDAVESVQVAPPAKAVSPAPKTVSMISKFELRGDALNLENDFGFETGFNPAGSQDLDEEYINQPALVSSLKTQESVRWIETFLKTGPSSASDNIFVRPASKTGPEKN